MREPLGERACQRQVCETDRGSIFGVHRSARQPRLMRARDGGFRDDHPFGGADPSAAVFFHSSCANFLGSGELPVNCLVAASSAALSHQCPSCKRMTVQGPRNARLCVEH